MKIGLFVPCYVDALYPEVGASTYGLLRHYGLSVDYPERQTCCGQPQGNAGFERMAEELAVRFEDNFSHFDYIVAPSASCAAYVKCFHPHILEGAHHPCTTTNRIMDVVEFLHDVVKVKEVPGRFHHRVSLHNSCHGVRELGLSTPTERMDEPRINKMRDLLQLVEGIDVVEPERPDECCGFGGMFSIEEPDVSTRMGLDKLRRHEETGAQYVTGPDSSCLMHLAGIARRQGSKMRFMHIVEILTSAG